MTLEKEQKEQLLQIVEIGKALGGSQQIDQMLMGEVMKILMPSQDSKMDELASLYSMTGDESVKSQLLAEYQSQQGINPEDQALMEKFSTEFSGEDAEFGADNKYMQTLATQSPEMLREFYNTPREKEEFDWKQIPKGAAAGAGVGAGGGALFGGIPGAGIGTVVGAGLGTIGGLIGAITDQKNESDKEKRARLESLVSQYQSNLPRQ